MNALPKRLQVPPGVVWTPINDDDIMILDVESGQYFRLADVGACLWRSWAEDGSVAKSIEAVVAEYEVEEDTVTADAADLIAELANQGLVRVVEP